MRFSKYVVALVAALGLSCCACPAFASDVTLSDSDPVPSMVAVSEILASMRDLSDIREDVRTIREILQAQQPDELSLSPDDDAEPGISADDIGVAVVDALIDAGVVTEDGTDGDSVLYAVRTVGGVSEEEDTEEPIEEATEEVTEEPIEEATEEVTEEPTEEATEEVTEEATEEATEEPTEEATEEPTTREMLSQLHTDLVIMIISIWGAALMIVGLLVGKIFFGGLV